jgi:hypothetical protein
VRRSKPCWGGEERGRAERGRAERGRGRSGRGSAGAEPAAAAEAGAAIELNAPVEAVSLGVALAVGFVGVERQALNPSATLTKSIGLTLGIAERRTPNIYSAFELPTPELGL